MIPPPFASMSFQRFLVNSPSFRTISHPCLLRSMEHDSFHNSLTPLEMTNTSGRAYMNREISLNLREADLDFAGSTKWTRFQHRSNCQVLSMWSIRSHRRSRSDAATADTAAAVLYSVMASAKANQVEPFAYVRDLLVQLSRHSPPATADLLPDAWLTSHPEARRCWSR